MDNEKLITNFPVTVYGNLEKYSNVISKGRCRLFYKGANRNGTFITDEFAEILLATIPYAPVKGIYDTDDGDYTDHGERRDLGRIYGVVPAEPNLAWEKHVDEDGIEREYACVDVLLYTALYEEAGQIFGKSQSMELYSKSIKGDWQLINGKRYYVFENACFLGLQALGDEVEPCFEGAAFFSLYQSLKDVVDKLEQYKGNFQNNGQGGLKMPTMNFRVSDEQKFNALWSLLNTNFNEENNWTIDFDICEVYDDYALVHNYNDNTFDRVYYSKDEATNAVSLGDRTRCYIVDVDESEKEVLEFLRKKGCHTFEQINAHFEDFEKLNNTISENNTKVEELNTMIATLTMERDEAHNQVADLNNKVEEANTQYAAAQNTIASVTTERDALAAYKKNVEDDAKKTVIESYTDNLTEDVLKQYTENLDKYTAEDLDMKLTYEVKKAHPEIFSHNQQPAYILKDVTPKSGLEDILSRYEKH